MHYIWNLLLYQPLVNALAFLVSIIPGGDIGIAVILLTILVKIILFPLSQAQIRNQAAMYMLTPELNKIKASGASKEEQARLTFELYKKHKTNPFSGCLVMIPMLLVIISLYSVFRTGLNFDNGILYSFIHIPQNTSMLFLGILDISLKKSLLLAVIAGISQYFQAYYMPKPPAFVSRGVNTNTPVPLEPGSFAENLNKSMSIQMKYVFPFVIALISYNFSGAVALYLITNNIFTVFQQIYVNKTEKKMLDEETELLIAQK